MEISIFWKDLKSYNAYLIMDLFSTLNIFVSLLFDIRGSGIQIRYSKKNDEHRMMSDKLEY